LILVSLAFDNLSSRDSLIPVLCAGNAATAMGGGAANGVPQPDGTSKPEATFDVEEVGRAIVYMASLPLGANVFNMTLM
jgi:hypothetical protein